MIALAPIVGSMKQDTPITLAETAHRLLRRDIVRGALAADTPLRLAALSERYGMGFSPLREALNRLQGERLVMSESLRGFRVAPLSIEAMRDTIETRVLVETEALRRAIACGDDAWEAEIVATLHALTRQAARAAPDDEAAFDLLEERHTAFHRALIAACGSEWLLDFSARLYVGSERYRHPALTARQPDAQRDIAAEHAEIAAAALARDANRAAERLTRHYRRTAEFIASALGEDAVVDQTTEFGTVR